MQVKIRLFAEDKDEIKGLLAGYGIKTNDLICRAEKEKDIMNICEAVRKYIVGKYEPSEICKTIKNDFGFLTSEQRQKLEACVTSAINNEEDINNKLFTLRRNRIIESAVHDCIEESSGVNIEGMLPFRLNCYRNELRELVEYNAEVMFAKQEYAEFIELLKMYVSTQPSLMYIINVIVTDNMEYIFLDESGKEPAADLTVETASEACVPQNSDDMLINMLIFNNPEKIVIHNKQNMKKETFDTVSGIFGGRITVCRGCALCGK